MPSIDNKTVKIIAERINNCMGVKTTQKELADAIKVSPTLVSSWLSPKSDRYPNISQLIKIADYFKVSVDYLLGQTDIKTRDTTTREICEKLHLSEKAVKALMSLDGNKEYSHIYLINKLALLEENNNAFELLNAINFRYTIRGYLRDYEERKTNSKQKETGFLENLMQGFMKNTLNALYGSSEEEYSDNSDLADVLNEHNKNLYLVSEQKIGRYAVDLVDEIANEIDP